MRASGKQPQLRPEFYVIDMIQLFMRWPCRRPRAIDRALLRLLASGPLSQPPDVAAGELTGDETLHDEPYAIPINDEFTVDVMNSASGLSWNDLARYRTRIEGIRVVSLEGLLRMKEHGRLKDQADAEAIRKALAGTPE